MSLSSGLMALRKFVFCLIDVWINSKIYLNVSELILKYLQSLSSSLSKSPTRLWNSPKLSRLELILCTQKCLFLLNKRLLHQTLSIIENTCTWFDILTVQKCQLHCFKFGSARLAMWIVTRSARFSSACSENEGSPRLARNIRSDSEAFTVNFVVDWNVHGDKWQSPHWRENIVQTPAKL